MTAPVITDSHAHVHDTAFEADREEALATSRKVGQIGGWASAATMPALRAFSLALALFLAFRVAGTRPAFRETFAVFVARTDVTLAAFGWRLVQLPDGPAYRWGDAG